MAVKCSWWQPVGISSLKCGSDCWMACQITISGASVYYKSKASLFLHLPDFSLVFLSQHLCPTPAAIISNSLHLSNFTYTSGFQLSSPLNPFYALSLALLGSGSFKKKAELDPFLILWAKSLKPTAELCGWENHNLLVPISSLLSPQKPHQDLKSVVTASSHTCAGPDTCTHTHDYNFFFSQTFKLLSLKFKSAPYWLDGILIGAQVNGFEQCTVRSIEALT